MFRKSKPVQSGPSVFPDDNKKGNGLCRIQGLVCSKKQQSCCVHTPCCTEGQKQKAALKQMNLKAAAVGRKRKPPNQTGERSVQQNKADGCSRKGSKAKAAANAGGSSLQKGLTLPELLSQLGLQGGNAVLLGQSQTVGVQATAGAHDERHLLLHSHTILCFTTVQPGLSADGLLTGLVQYCALVAMALG